MFAKKRIEKVPEEVILAQKKKKKITLKEHLETFHVTKRAKDKMLALIKFRKEYDNLPRYMKDAPSLSVS